MSERRYSRPRHVLVENILRSLDAAFLARARCYFGGGTRIVLDLDEYRESADIDLLCSSREGYRELRSTVRNDSLGDIASGRLALAREVIADRYGLRTFIDIGGDKIKFEIVNEGRIDLSGSPHSRLRVPCLDKVSCFAEKFLANDDRWNDEAALSRDAIDLAFMIEGWGPAAALEGRTLARGAYGDSVEASAQAAARNLIRKKDYFRKCVAGLRVTRTATLASGLKKLAAGKWAGKRRK
jgi:hypothetical protein